MSVDIGGDPARADLVVTGPDTLDAARACRGERLALALRPLGGRFPQTPDGFADYAVEVPGQGDRFAPFAPVDPNGPALAVGGTELTAAQVVERARGDATDLGLTAPGARLLSGKAYDSWDGLSAGLYAPLAMRLVGGAVPQSGPAVGRGAGQADRERAGHHHGVRGPRRRRGCLGAATR